jgi:hypothetical protein
MGTTLAEVISRRLSAQGLPPDTPAAVGHALGRPTARVQVVDLATLPDGAARRDPALWVVTAVGEVSWAAVFVGKLASDVGWPGHDPNGSILGNFSPSVILRQGRPATSSASPTVSRQQGPALIRSRAFRSSQAVNGH